MYVCKDYCYNCSFASIAVPRGDTVQGLAVGAREASSLEASHFVPESSNPADNVHALQGAATLAKQGANGKAGDPKPTMQGLDSVQESAESNLQRRSS